MTSHRPNPRWGPKTVVWKAAGTWRKLPLALLPLVFLGVFLAVLLRAFLGSGPLLLAQKLYSGDRVQQGRVLQAFIYPVSRLESSEFALLDSKGQTVAHSEGFLLNYRRGVLAGALDAHTRDWVYLGLVGVPASQEAGNYTLRASLARKGPSSQTLERPIYIQSIDFPTQTIRIDQRMNAVLHPSDPDIAARKRLQANQLWAILKRSDARDLYYSGVLLRPVVRGQGWDSSPYGYVRKYVYPGGKVTRSIHRGYDIAAPQGVSVLASADGLVALAEDRIVTGKTVMLTILPGVYLKYQHLSTLNVVVGGVVKRGEVLGQVGQSGFATGNHLHTELWVSSQRVDPTPYFEQPLIDTNEIVSMIAGN